MFFSDEILQALLAMSYQISPPSLSSPSLEMSRRNTACILGPHIVWDRAYFVSLHIGKLGYRGSRSVPRGSQSEEEFARNWLQVTSRHGAVARHPPNFGDGSSLSVILRSEKMACRPAVSLSPLPPFVAFIKEDEKRASNQSVMIYFRHVSAAVLGLENVKGSPH